VPSKKTPNKTEFIPLEQRKSMRELCQIATTREVVRPEYTTIDLWRHFQAHYAFSHHERLLSEYFDLSKEKTRK
jgi:hypothetical protein